eukprot:TRINITY_DN12733_c0_g1_i1.p1 TRINITY_DN12733_c0_g1~~TRINITY_DN12733_c0_g1_i1.p1  ORF type:complete len:412 (-),score=68.95 TRINITY_DN12733_c0_g1_i1:69-1304(-)
MNYQRHQFMNSEEFATFLEMLIFFFPFPSTGSTEEVVRPSNLTNAYPKSFTSAYRSYSQKVCGWPINITSFGHLMSTLAKEGNHTRAAAIAVWCGEFERAQLLLKEAGRFLSPLVTVTLSGYQEGGQLWRSTLSTLAPQMTDPYLVAMFLFLCVDASVEDSSRKTYARILDDGIGLSLVDRIAFASKFLIRDELFPYLCELRDKAISEGTLEGLLLTGIDETGLGVKLLQNYLDRTGDIQTTTLLVAQVSRKKVNFPLIDQWIQIYSNLLDQWQLWFERANFDVDRVPNLRPVSHVVAICKFCGSPLSVAGKIRHTSGHVYSERIKACPNCSKPLPRCAICLSPFECTPFDSRSVQKDPDHYWASGSNPFKDWFSWCQTCKHGGHVNHMREWFQEHKDCPVATCNCTCMSL